MLYFSWRIAETDSDYSPRSLQSVSDVEKQTVVQYKRSGPKGEFLGGINYQRSPEEFLWCSEARAGGQEGDLGDGFHWL